MLCLCAPPTIAGESRNSSTTCGSDRDPSVQVRTPADARLSLLQASPTMAPSVVAATGTHPPSRRGCLPVCTSHCCRRVQEWLCEVWWQPLPSSIQGRRPMRASHRRGRVQQRIHAVWRRLAPTSIQARTHVGAHLPPSQASPGMALRGVMAADTHPSV
jgi:hypothetical protein